MYCELPEGHRTTFVVGMSDMLGTAYLYAAPEHKPRIDAMLRYLIGYENEIEDPVNGLYPPIVHQNKWLEIIRQYQSVTK
jgi:hypothetical protein